MLSLKGDKIVFDIGGNRYALNTEHITSVVEVERVFFMPGAKSFIDGVISLKGDPVLVVNLAGVIGLEEGSEGPKKVIVLQDKRGPIGLNIGDSRIFFLWNDELEGFEVKEEEGRYIFASIDLVGRPIKLVDWKSIYTDAEEMMSHI